MSPGSSSRRSATSSTRPTRRSCACARRATRARAARRAARRRRLRRACLRQVGRRPLAARLARRARRPRRRAPLRRRGRHGVGVAHRQGPPRRYSHDRRPHPAVRLAGGKRARGLLPAWACERPAGPAAGGVARRVAVAGRRLELRQEGQRLPLLVQRVAAPDVGPARVLGSQPANRQREKPPSAPRSSSSTIGSSAPSRRASRSSLPSPRCTSRRSGTTTSSARSLCSRAWVTPAIRARLTGSSCSKNAASQTAAGAPAAAGGRRPDRREATSRSSTGARARASS